MSRPARLWLFAVAGAGLLAVLLIGLHGLPAFGHADEIYGRVVNRIELARRHATDIVTALNFDVRAFDTLGEEFILFASVAGVALLLRDIRTTSADVARRTGQDDHSFAGASDSLRLLALILIGPMVAFGGYIVVHGQLTPGGGFQGGVVMAAGPLAVLLAGRYLAARRIAPEWALEAVDSIGGFAYALIGLGGLVFSGVFLANFLPLGTPGKLLSGGTIPVSSVAVGIEVAGAFLLTWTEFLDQALIVPRQNASG